VRLQSSSDLVAAVRLGRRFEMHAVQLHRQETSAERRGKTAGSTRSLPTRVEQSIAVRKSASEGVRNGARTLDQRLGSFGPRKVRPPGTKRARSVQLGRGKFRALKTRPTGPKPSRGQGQ